jgi:CRP/FNR family cyclic AMP-dependent transcriptional regulator
LSSRLMIWQSESSVIKDSASDGHREFRRCKIALLDARRPAPKRMSTKNGRYLAGTAGALDQAFSDDDLFALLFGDCIADTMPSGKHLFLQEDRSDRIFGLIEGSVEISIYSIDGQKLVANVQMAPSIIGEIGALDGGLRTATAICRSDCLIVSLDRLQLLRRIEESPQLARTILQLVCKRVRWMTESLGDHAFLNIEGRLAKRLLLLNSILADPSGWIGISQSEIAEFLGATRESVNKLLNGWRSRSLIDVRRGRIKITNSRSLRQLATEGSDTL